MFVLRFHTSIGQYTHTWTHLFPSQRVQCHYPCAVLCVCLCAHKKHISDTNTYPNKNQQFTAFECAQNCGAMHPGGGFSVHRLTDGVCMRHGVSVERFGIIVAVVATIPTSCIRPHTSKNAEEIKLQLLKFDGVPANRQPHQPAPTLYECAQICRAVFHGEPFRVWLWGAFHMRKMCRTDYYCRPIHYFILCNLIFVVDNIFIEFKPRYID